MKIREKLKENIQIRRSRLILYVIAGFLIGGLWGLSLAYYIDVKTDISAFEKIQEQRREISNIVNQ